MNFSKTTRTGAASAALIIAGMLIGAPRVQAVDDEDFKIQQGFAIARSR
jgi:hypothetical protein